MNLPEALHLVNWDCCWVPARACLGCPDSLPLTRTQMTESLERHQEKLEEKQAACLEQIREMEKQVTGTTTLAPSIPSSPHPASFSQGAYHLLTYSKLPLPVMLITHLPTM